MDRWISKVAVVTGASSGIGAAIAERLIKEGLIVVGISRRKEKIDQLSQKLKAENGKLYAVKADLTKEEEILNAFKWVKDNVGPIHILVNSAGIFGATNLTNGDTQVWKRVLDINVLALCITTREAIKDMRANEINGHIIHINSIGGHRRGSPYANVSGASKYSVTALTETLRQELNSIGSKIKITSLSPGYTRTEIFEATFAAVNRPVPKELEEQLKNDVMLEPEDLADAAVYILGTPPHVQVHELTIIPTSGRII